MYSWTPTWSASMARTYPHFEGTIWGYTLFELLWPVSPRIVYPEIWVKQWAQITGAEDALPLKNLWQKRKNYKKKHWNREIHDPYLLGVRITNVSIPVWLWIPRLSQVWEDIPQPLPFSSVIYVHNPTTHLSEQFGGYFGTTKAMQCCCKHFQF